MTIDRFLEEKYSVLRRVGDVQLMSSLEEVGVSLFYHLTSIFTDEAAHYPPLKQLITTCVESLGQVTIRIISEKENHNRSK